MTHENDSKEPVDGEIEVYSWGTVEVLTTDDEYREVSLSDLQERELREGKLVVD